MNFFFLSIDELMIDYRKKMLKHPPTPRDRLRALESQVAQSETSTMNELRDWLTSNHFHLLLLMGEDKDCDEQYYRQIGKGRYHWRIYEFTDKIIIESHVDRYDPGRGLTKSRTVKQIIDDAIGHINKDVIEEPKHHVILLWKRPTTDSFLDLAINFVRKIVTIISQ